GGAGGAGGGRGRGREDHAARVRGPFAAGLHPDRDASVAARRERIPSTPVPPSACPTADLALSERAYAGPIRRLCRSAVEPGGHESPAVVVAEVRGEVFDVGFPGGDRQHRGVVVVVDLLGQVALDVED